MKTFAKVHHKCQNSLEIRWTRGCHVYLNKCRAIVLTNCLIFGQKISEILSKLHQMEEDSNPESAVGTSTGKLTRGDASGGGNRCVMGECSNRNREGFSLYSVPSQPASVTSKWVTFISGTRKFKLSDYAGKVYICSGHFNRDQFEETDVRMYKQGLRKMAPNLKPNAVPKLKRDKVLNPFPPDFFDKPGVSNDSSEFDQLMTELAELKASAAAKAEQKKSSKTLPSSSATLSTPDPDTFITHADTQSNYDIPDPDLSSTHCPTCGHRLVEESVPISVPAPSKKKAMKAVPVKRPQSRYSDEDESSSGSTAKRRRRSDYGGSTYLYQQVGVFCYFTLLSLCWQITRYLFVPILFLLV